MWAVRIIRAAYKTKLFNACHYMLTCVLHCYRSCDSYLFTVVYVLQACHGLWGHEEVHAFSANPDQ